ncbi:cytochrome P450 [Roridomyces roridus]|uniref:Cytochrome P450 n=1 Tax=Roridomyces roridus TaxID=1738132 RepID=A0AAD7FFR9_9AGAR|nr:cytochrome P450 [Roridomyces roridus]
MAALHYLIPLVVAALAYLRKIGTREKGLPPGPPTIPILGNLHIFPTEYVHYKFTEWAQQYGGIYSASFTSLKMGPGTAIVLTDATAVKTLMDKRSANTSDRPPMYISDLVTGGLNMAFARYGDIWRTLRKTAHAILTPQATALHLPIQRAEATQLLHDILGSPKSFYTHIGRYSSSVILSVLYGKRAPRFETAETKAFFEVEHDYMEGVLEKQEEYGLTKEMAGYLAGLLIEGGSETTSAFLNTMILALTACPEVQRKAQEEMDRVVGGDRMPTLEDLEHMPYIRSIILEGHRMRPVFPLLVPHAVTEADEYEGYVIPQGATIFVNIYGILHDPALYDSPEEFIPERYLTSEHGTKPGVDASDMRLNPAFGVGRRSCSGIHLASNSINLNTMNFIWAFDFKPALDAAGEPIKADLSAYSKGLTSGPIPFECRISPRSQGKIDIIEREFVDATAVFEKFEYGLSPEDQEFTEWAKQYGGMYSLKMGSTTAIVLSDASVVKEFLEKRSATTSDRPVRHIIELVTGRLELGFSQYNDTWRTLRKAAHAILTQKATENHLPIQEAESTQLLHDILCTPQFFYQHVGRYSNSVILSVIYGTRAPQYSTPETLALFKVERRWTSFLDEGATPPIDRFPVLKFVPERWAKWKREAKEIRALRRELFFGLLERTEERLRKGQPNGSYAEEWLMRKEELGMDREQIGYLAGSLITGGSDTTSAYLTSLILALVAHPEVQKKAQEEIDRVVGQDRMPALEDLLGDQMPYIRALILESHRFRPIIPISHRAFSAPDQVRGTASLTSRY